MRIIILDGYTVNPGDVSWDILSQLGELIVYDHTLPDEVLKHIGNAEIILTNKVLITRNIIQHLPNLKYIGILATGVNNVDLIAAREKNIMVTNIPAYSTDSVVQMVFAYILHFTQRVEQHAQSVSDGKWTSNRDFCFWETSLIELKGKILGIIGGGRIGQAVASVGNAFGMKVIMNTPHPEKLKSDTLKVVLLEEVFRTSDFVSLHCPLNDKTKHIINEKSLLMMKPGAYLINTGRGGLVDEMALAQALNSGKLAGAGLDVLSEEPPVNSSPLIGAKNCIITPHIGWATIEARKRLIEIASDNIQRFITGNPVNVVN